MQQNRCLLPDFEDDGTLSELAHLRKRSLEDLLRLIELGDIDLKHRVRRAARKRLADSDQEQPEHLQRTAQSQRQLSYQVLQGLAQGLNIAEFVDSLGSDPSVAEPAPTLDQSRPHRPDPTVDDVERSLREYIQRGELRIDHGRVQITPKGARKLAGQVLARVMDNLADGQLGPHNVDQSGYGSWVSRTSRRYEIGDEYHKIDFETTLLNALERQSSVRHRLKLEPEDFHVYEEIHQTKMVAGLLIDQSGSMNGDKLNAAIDTSLALAELIRREPEDVLKVYLFSQDVQEIPYYDIVNVSVPQGFTDIRAALQAFRTTTSNANGDRQAYLITDAEPNTDHGAYVGFEKASAGVVEEALHYRKANITLNVIMLDKSPRLRQLASLLAKQNLGRVFFTSPTRLGQVVIEDYLTRKKRQLRNSPR